MAVKLTPIHPGEILKVEFLDPMGVSQYELARSIEVPLPRVNSIVIGKRGVSADTALRLAKYFGTSAEFWCNLQARYDLETRRRELGRKLEHLLVYKGREMRSECRRPARRTRYK